MSYRDNKLISSGTSSDDDGDDGEADVFNTPDTPTPPIEMANQLSMEELRNALASVVVAEQQTQQRLEFQGKALDTLTQSNTSIAAAVTRLAQPKQKDLVGITFPILELPRQGDEGEKNFAAFFSWQEHFETKILTIPYWDQVPILQRNAAIISSLGKRARALTNIQAADYGNVENLFRALRRDISGMEQETQALLYLEKQVQKQNQDITAYHNSLRRIFVIAHPEAAQRNWALLVRQFVRTLVDPALKEAVYNSYLGQPMTADYDAIRERVLNVQSNLNMRSLDSREVRENSRAPPMNTGPEPMDTSYINRQSRRRGRSSGSFRSRSYRGFQNHSNRRGRGESSYRGNTSTSYRGNASTFRGRGDSHQNRGRSNSRRPFNSRGSTSFRGNRGTSAPPYMPNRGQQPQSSGSSESRKCYGCNSTQHLVKDCPKKYTNAVQEEPEQEEVHLVDPQYESSFSPDGAGGGFDFL